MHPSPSAGTVRPPSVRVCMAASCSGAEPVDERGLKPAGNRRGPARSSRPQRRVPPARVPPARGVLSAGPVESYGLGSLAALVAGVLAASPARTAPSPPSLARVGSLLAGCPPCVPPSRTTRRRPRRGSRRPSRAPLSSSDRRVPRGTRRTWDTPRPPFSYRGAPGSEAGSVRMCGLSGEITFDGSLADTAAVGRMVAALVPRGPDGQGTWSAGRVAFGHRRLSVIDLSTAGAQPMVDNEFGLTAVFNGCIY